MRFIRLAAVASVVMLANAYAQPAPTSTTADGAAIHTESTGVSLSEECEQSHDGDGVKKCVEERLAIASMDCNLNERKKNPSAPDADLEEQIRVCMIEKLGRDLEMTGNRIYRFRERGSSGRIRLPAELRCTKYDFRTFHSCLKTQFFRPSGRVYFDVGTDQPDEVDLFQNGNLSPSIDFISISLPWRLGRPSYYDAWSWGPVVAVGITSAAKDSADGDKEASSAPVAMLSVGMQIEYKIEKGPSLAVELGYATGFSADESFSTSSSRSDGAVYLGLKINVPDKSKGE